MSNQERKTGLGRSAFFQGKPALETEATAEEKPKKVRTTVSLYTETMAGLEALKIEARKETGRKVTYSDVLNEAIADLMKKKGIELDNS